jgi:hypothetical protein
MIANGIATAPALTANSKAGNYTATATATGITTPANFNLTNLLPTTTPEPISTTPPELVSTTPPELEALRQQQRNRLSPRLLSDFLSVTFLLSEDIEPAKINSFLAKVVELMNQNGGTFSIEAIAILRDTKIGLIDSSTNENAIKVAIQRAIVKSIGSEYLSLVDIQSDIQDKKQIFKINVRKSLQPAKLKS